MTFKKIPYQSCGQILPRFSASEEALEVLNEEMPVAQAIQTLQENELNNDLIQFLAHALPVREAIWWAAMTLLQRQDVWSTSQVQCIQTAQQWAQSPSEELRRKSELLANRLDLNCGPSWLAQAVFWNGSGSIVAPDLPAVLPDPFLYAKAVAGAINHSAALPTWNHTDQYYTKSIGYAINIASGSTDDSH